MSKLILNSDAASEALVGSEAPHTPGDGQSIEKPKLNRQTYLNDDLQRLRSHIIQSDEKGLPRYGVLSILARRVPFFLYDHPAFIALCDTAFTDGVHIFVNAEFFVEVTNNDKTPDDSGLRTHSMVLILLHELMHILLRHHARMPPNAPLAMWAIACDVAINIRLLQSYPQLRPGPIFDEAWGTKDDEIQRYRQHAEEEILHDIWESPSERDAPLIEALKQQSRSDGDNGSGDDTRDERGDAQDIQHHLVSPQAVAKQLEENGLQHIREILELPNPHDKAAYQDMQSRFELHLVGDLDQAQQLREEHPGGQAMAGQHIETTLTEWVHDHYRGQIEWKRILRDMMLGEGMKYEHCDEMPADIYYVAPEQMNMDVPLFIGSQVPAAPTGNVLCIVDTSRSVSLELLSVFFSEITSLLEHEDIQQSQLLVTSADTMMRGDIMNYSPRDVGALPEKMLAHGRGGTDFCRVIAQSIQWADQQTEFDREDLSLIIYLTDLLDRPPKRAQLPERLPQLLFLSPPSLNVKTFKKSVEAFATVAEIKDGTVVDLCQR